MELPAGSSDRNILDKLWVQEDPKKVDQVDPKTWTLVGVAPTDVDPWKLQKIRGKRRDFLKTKVSFPTKKLQMQVLRSLFMAKMSLSES
jgi:hypothetical protein